MKYRLLFISLSGLFLTVLSGCGLNTSISSSQNTSHEVVLSKCPQPLPSSSITTIIPQADPHFLYVGSAEQLYALNAANGAMLWCNQVRITGDFPCPHSCPPGPFMLFGEPTIVDGVVYVCASGYQGYTYAFRARDGSLLWRVNSNCTITSIPFLDYALPLVDHSIVYTGSYALQAQDGKILWSSSVGASFQLLVDGILYANTEDTIYALNAKNGAILLFWRFTSQGPGLRQLA